MSTSLQDRFSRCRVAGKRRRRTHIFYFVCSFSYLPLRSIRRRPYNNIMCRPYRDDEVFRHPSMLSDSSLPPPVPSTTRPRPRRVSTMPIGCSCADRAATSVIPTSLTLFFMSYDFDFSAHVYAPRVREVESRIRCFRLERVQIIYYYTCKARMFMKSHIK